MTIALYARRKRWPLDEVAVRLRHSRVHAEDCADCETKQGMLDVIEREISLSGALASSLCLDVRRLVEADPVTEGVDDLDAKRAAVGALDTRAKVEVVLGQQLRVIGRKAPHAYEDGRSRASAAVVLGEVEDESITRHLHVEWEPSPLTVCRITTRRRKHAGVCSQPRRAR